VKGQSVATVKLNAALFKTLCCWEWHLLLWLLLFHRTEKSVSHVYTHLVILAIKQTMHML